jgi:hypothetical protein
MEASAVINWSTGGVASTLSLALSPYETAQIAASKYGFFDLDIDSDDRVVRIVASAIGRSVTAKGKSLTMAVENLLEIFTNE